MATEPTPTPAWKVTAQRPTYVTVDDKATQAMVVNFTTAAGVDGSVTVPLAEYTVAGVAAAINAQAEVINGVHNLEAPPG
jgi:ABC-type hemin transport system substrate-binding protein